MKHPERTRVFDQSAALWDEKPQRVKMGRSIAEAILRTARPSSSMDLFDYGCGTGLLSLMLLPHVRSVTGADTSGGMLKQFQKKIDRQRLTNVRLMQIDLGEVPAPDDRFDLIITSMTLHHVEHLDHVLRNFHTLLRPGGTVCLIDLDTERGNFHRNVEEACVFHFGFDRSELKSKLRSLGFVDARDATAMILPRELEGGGQADFPIFIISASRSTEDASPRG
jgi:ubiquinone/menaquinone biosynthesis C-methylase UbiE